MIVPTHAQFMVLPAKCLAWFSFKAPSRSKRRAGWFAGKSWTSKDSSAVNNLFFSKQ